jgi:hypothetical protein
MAQTTVPNEWTWRGGPSTGAQTSIFGTEGIPIPGNVPAARSQAAIWTDSNGNFWMFGGGLGYLYGSSELLATLGRSEFVFNDLWKFNPSANEWTWMGHGTTVNQSGVYGALRTTAPGDFPGGRLGASSWN